MSRVIDHFPSWMTGGGIFVGLTDMPWDDSDLIDPEDMDIEYFGNHSGLKESSPLLEKMTSWPNDHVLTDVEIGILQRLIKQKYSHTWSCVWDALLAEYNPIENYSMVEETTPGTTKTVKVETDEKIANKSTGSIYGFNSSTAVPASHNEGESNTTGSKAKNYTEESYTGKDTHTRSGNIGVMTSQMMITQELELRKNAFLDIVYNDVDKILTRPSWR